PVMGNNAAAVDEQHHIFFTGGYSTDTFTINSVLYRYSPENGALGKIVPPAQALIGFGNAMLADQQGHLYITQGFTTPGNPRARAAAWMDRAMSSSSAVMTLHTRARWLRPGS